MVPNAALTIADCGVPAVAVIVAGGPARLVTGMGKDPVSNGPESTKTVQFPGIVLAVRGPAVAMPCALVSTLLFAIPPKLPDGPGPLPIGMKNDTGNPDWGTGFPN